ncbi:hypothetical protein I5M27_00745 [Adhaeribacter sp. BT258]|uniref:Capsule assembly protein Wzi n=1 Tax=Adhaeribacter terrigena TaxID=2793070 RepID=A0ABS1BWI7_9BACT|nr:hypothetical protein [Adhaeribacter terrigena]
MPNQAFQKAPQVNPAYAKELRLGIRTLGFFKNNEYFNKIADGYTLFGYHFMPSLSYYPSEKVKVEAGALLWKDFGSFKITRLQPTFTVTYTSGAHTLLFGTLNGNANFNYIEPLWDFERQLLVPLQNGVQYVYQKPKFDLQAFIDWQVMQYRFDTQQEEVGGGFTSNIALYRKLREVAYNQSPHQPAQILVYQKHNLNLPIQFTGFHQGGQIDTNDRPLTTLFNGTVGLEYTFTTKPREIYTAYGGLVSKKDQFLKSIYTKNYFVGYDDYSFEHQLPFQGGSGIYLNVGTDIRKFGELMVSYWRGNGYISEFGGRLYQSASTTVKNPGYIEKKRELLIIRHMSTFHLTEGVSLTNRFEPFFDLNKGTFEFSTGFYVHFDTDFFLGKPRLQNPNP